MKTHLGVIAAGILAPALAFATNGYFDHGYGLKAKGMGGVGFALPQDALAAATNPAGIAFVGHRIDAGLELFRPHRGADIVGNPMLSGSYDGNHKANFLIPEFGYNRPISEKLTFGVAVYGNGGMNTDYARSPFGAIGGSSPAGVDLMQLFVAPTLAWKLTPQHALGVSLTLAMQRFQADGLEPFAQMSANPSALTNKGYDTSYGLGLHVGWTGRIGERLTVGAAYRSKTRMSRFKDYAGLYADQGDFDIPASWGVGLALQPTPALTIAFDVQRIEYSDVAAVGNPINSLFAGSPLGSDDGPGFGWRDVTVYKLGVAYRLSERLTLRGGYNYGEQPIPGDQTFFNTLAPGTVEQHVTLGATWTLASGNEITFMYARALKKTVRGNNSIPPAFGGGEADIHLSEDLFGVAFGWRF